MNVCESDGVCVCVHGQDAGMNVCESVLPFEERHVLRTFCSDSGVNGKVSGWNRFPGTTTTCAWTVVQLVLFGGE